MSTRFIKFYYRAISLYALVLLWQRMAVNLRAAHKTLLTCFLHRAAHEVWLVYSARNIARMQYTKVYSHAANYMSHVSFD